MALERNTQIRRRKQRIFTCLIVDNCINGFDAPPFTNSVIDIIVYHNCHLCKLHPFLTHLRLTFVSQMYYTKIYRTADIKLANDRQFILVKDGKLGHMQLVSSLKL